MIRIDAELPKICNDCPLMYSDDDGVRYYCVLTDNNVTDIKYLGKDGGCPLVDECCKMNNEKE